MITSKQARLARESLGMSQTVVARETGISRSYLSQFENGSLQLAKPLIDKLQEFLENKGYEFGASSSESAGEALKTAAISAEERLNQKMVKGEETVVVETEELSELIGLLGDFVVHSIQPEPANDNQSDVVILPELAGNKKALDLVSAFEQSEAAIIKHLEDDAKGAVKNGGFLGSNVPSYRAEKLLAAMAIQYIRSVALKTGKLIVPISSLAEIGVFSSPEKVAGRDASEIVGILKDKMEYTYPELKKHMDQNVVVAA